jgi:hypothetical protein
VFAASTASTSDWNDRKGMLPRTPAEPLRDLAGSLLALALASAAALALARATLPDAAPSLRTLLAAAAPTLLAPLFWPGLTTARLRRGLGYAAGVGTLALLGTLALNTGQQLWPTTLAAAAVAAIIAFGSHGLAGTLQLALERQVAGVRAREAALVITLLTLWLLAAAPVWLSPLAESHASSTSASPWLADLLLNVSPLAQLAVAAGNDLLRNDWFYAHSALAGMPVSYPRLALVLPAWLALGALPSAIERRARPARPNSPVHAALESPS